MKKDNLTTMIMRKRNRSKVMAIIIKKVTATKNELQIETQFSYSTIGNILNDLLNENYISITEKGPSTGGRKPKVISLNYSNYLFLSIDLSCHNFHWAVQDLRGVIIFDHYYNYDYGTSFQNNIELFLSQVHELCSSKEIDLKFVCGVGIATPGYYREEDDQIFHSSYQDLETIKIKKTFSKFFNTPIFIVNDANVAAYNEISNYNYSESECIFYLLITGDGVGSAIAIRGEIFLGAKGYAGETHLIPILYNEKVSSMGDMLYPQDDIKYLSDQLGRPIDDQEFFILFKERNPHAMEIYEKTIYTMAESLFQIFNILNPSDILISGFYNRYGTQMTEDILTIMKEKVTSYQIEGLKISLSHFSDKTILSGLGKKLIDYWCNHI